MSWQRSLENASGLTMVFILALMCLLAIVLTPLFLVGIPAYVAYRLYRDSPWRHERIARQETFALYNHALSGTVDLSDTQINAALMQRWSEDTPAPLRIQLLEIAREIFAREDLMPDIPPPPALCNTVEAARYRDRLARIGQARHDEALVLSAAEKVSRALAPIAAAAPSIESDVLVEIRQFLEPIGATIEQIITPFFEESDTTLFKDLRTQLDFNLRKTHRTEPVFPSDYKGADAIGTYLKDTPLKQIFSLRTPFRIPEKGRFEHTHIVAGSGHGKTQTLQYLISEDIRDIEQCEKSVVVIDSQGDLIETILSARHLPAEQIVLIDPEDIKFPVSLNLFSVGQERLEEYDDLERERLTNSIIELYDFVLGSLLASGMTAKQSVVFRYVTRLMFHIPGATIHTLRELMEPGGTQKYQKEIAELTGTPKQFFETEFDGKEFASTKTQVLRRLYGVLENQTFERMFSHPTSKFDMFTEMNAGKLILINTSKSLLKEQGTEILGRFFIALIAQAAQERATLPAQDRLPVMVYVDEAQDYFDQNIGVILSQARKYKVGMVMAHQYLGQLTCGLQEAFEANTSIKLAGGVSARDARTLASQMSTDADMLLGQQKGSFATFIRGFTKQAVPMSFPFFVLEKQKQTPKELRDAIRQHSRDAYAEPYENMAQTAETPGDEAQEAPPKNEDDDPAKPSSEL